MKDYEKKSTQKLVIQAFSLSKKTKHVAMESDHDYTVNFI